jgi:hypothetical protein
MNSLQINKILKRYLRQYFRGVHASDGIPPLSGPYPYAVVVNTDKAGEPGKHWQAIWILSDIHAEFFDSFGNDPKGNIKMFIQKFKKVEKNTIKLQKNFEISCGPYVIYFLINRFRGYSLKTIVNNLHKQIFSDVFVKFFVHILLKL